jgi:hypothetical protein
MRIIRVVAVSCVFATSVAGCAAVPDLPGELEVPVQDILHHAVCELRIAFEILSNKEKYPGFNADQWAVSISLTPKTDTELTANFGATGSSTSNSKAIRFVTWTLGSPGLQFDLKGHRDSAVSFPLHSSQLLDEKNYPLAGCENEGAGYASLSQHLGVAEWLERIAPQEGLDKVTSVDKPVFNSEIIVKYDGGNAGATWTVPIHTYTGSLFGSRTSDQTLSIAFTPDPKKVPVKTLPEGAPIVKPVAAAPRTIVSPAALNRLDQIQQEEILRNLRVQPF